MIVKVVIKRDVKEGREKDFFSLLKSLRASAMLQEGYISGETLFSLECPEECLVISRWTTLEHWQQWNRTARRIEFDDGMAELLGTETEYRFYGVGLW